MKLKPIAALLLATGFGLHGCYSHSTPETGTYSNVQRRMADEILYFLIPDRFADGDKTNNCGGYTQACSDTDGQDKVLTHGYMPTDKGYYHGGDIPGLISKLDYLQNLGVTALWVGPIFKNKPVQEDSSNLYGMSSGYHGYWITDFMQVDPHLGTNADFAALVEGAHKRGIKVFMDIITNHTADVIQFSDADYAYKTKEESPYLDVSGNAFDDSGLAYSGQADYSFPEMNEYGFPHPPIVPDAEITAKNPAWLNDPLLYHNRGNTSFSGENSVYGDFFGLDDLFTERKEVVDGMIAIYKHWIDTYKVDGFRIDTTKHVNVGFWQAFGPAMQAAAKAAGIENFFAFGEVYDSAYDPAFKSLFSTKAKLQSTIDFGFQAAARNFASKSLATDDLRDFFAGDDYYTDADSDAYRQPVFLGNHDMGRIGNFLKQDQPEAADAELLARDRLAHSLLFFARGQPVLYYGDEQGFTGDDGGDKNAREDMFPSQVAVYNDNDLIGTDASTADDNFDATHPMYGELQALAAVYKAHQALRSGTQIHRYSSGEAGIYAFSRIENDERLEYLVVLNNANAEKTATIPTASAGQNFTLLRGDGAESLLADVDGNVNASLPAFGYAVYQAATALTEPAVAPLIDLKVTDSTPEQAEDAQTLYRHVKDGYEVVDRLQVRAEVSSSDYLGVEFFARVGDGDYQSLGTDRAAPYQVYYDASGLADAAEVAFMARITLADGQISEATLPAQPVVITTPELAGPKYNYAVIHYQRSDNAYGSETGGDCWGVHAWGDAVREQGDWGKPVCMNGEDDFGRFAYLPLNSTSVPVNFIIHTPGGDSMGVNREPGGDRSFDAAVTPEVWIVQDDVAVHRSNPGLNADTSKMVLHYRRPAGDYSGWGLHVWGDTSATPTWDAPLLPVSTDSFGQVYEVPLTAEAASIGYLFHKGDEKDPGLDQGVNFAAQGYEAWQVQGADVVDPYINANPDVSKAVIHYRRPDGDYSGWGLHVWGDTTATPEWTTPVLPVRTDAYGAVFEVPLTDAAQSIGYLIHKGDEKDPNGDLGLTFAKHGYEVWQEQGAAVENPHIIPTIANF